MTGLTGTLGFGPTNAFRVRSIEDGANTFTKANPRPSAPDAVGGTLKVGSLNVLNYFTTLAGSASATTAIGQQPRGANSSEELARQTEKLVTTLIGTGPTCSASPSSRTSSSPATRATRSNTWWASSTPGPGPAPTPT